MLHRLWVVGLLLSTGQDRSAAHDVWIEPASFRPEVGKELAIRIFVGDLPEREEVARKPDRIFRLDAIGPSRTTPIEGEAGKTPAGVLRVTETGLQLIVYETRHSLIELDAAKFTEYLREDGMEEIIAEREQLGESQQTAKEKYRRFCKALVGEGESGFDRRVGLPYELIPERNPAKWTAGQELVFRLEFLGAPLAGAKVKAMCVADPSKTVSARTDAQGRVKLTPGGSGVWYAGSVHMRRAAEELQCEWESFWATCSFELSDRGPSRSK